MLRVLHFSQKPPYPTIDGGCVAIKNVLENLHHLNFKVKHITLSSEKHPFSLKNYPPEIVTDCQPETITVDLNTNALGAISSILKSENYNLARFYSSENSQSLLDRIRGFQPNFIVFDGFFSTVYLNDIKEAFPEIKCVLRSHNLEHTIWLKQSQNAKNPVKKRYFKLLAKQIKKEERNQVKKLSAIASINYKEQAFYTKNGANKVVNLPVGVKPNHTDFSIKENCYFHLGAMDWEANQIAISHFLKDIWPKHLKSHPQDKLYLAGKSLKKYISGLSKDLLQNVICINKVEDVQSFMRNHGTMIVPVKIAAGLRIKILEGLAYGVPIIASEAACDGIKTNKSFINKYTSKKEFLEQMDTMSSNPEFLYEMSKNAVKFAEANFSNTEIQNQLKLLLTK